MDTRDWRIQHVALDASGYMQDTGIRERHNQLVVVGERIVAGADTLYVDLDVEADGKPGFGSLRSVGAAIPSGETFYRELRPTSDQYVVGMHQFCEDHELERERLMDEGEDPAEVMRELDTWTREHAGGKPATLTAFNASFDYAWVDLEMLKAGVDHPFGVAGYCIKSLAMSLGVLGGEGDSGITYEWRDTAKSRLPLELLPEGDFTHNALDDALWQQELHYALAGLHARLRYEIH